MSSLAVTLCDERIRRMQNDTGQTNFGIPYHDPIQRTDEPLRTDLPAGTPITQPRLTVLERLWREQDERCNGCRRVIPEDWIDTTDLDHVIPRSRGGEHIWENVQLLCRTCNVKKGNRLMAELRRRLQAEQG